MSPYSMTVMQLAFTSSHEIAAQHSPVYCRSTGCLPQAPAPAVALSKRASGGWLQLSFSSLCGKAYILPAAAASGTVCCRRLHSQLQQLRQQSRAQAGVDAVAPRSVRRTARTPLSQRTDATQVSDDGRDGWGKKEGPSRSHHYLRDDSSLQGWEKVNYAPHVALPCSGPQHCHQATFRAQELSCGPPLASQVNLGNQGLLSACSCWPALSSCLRHQVVPLLLGSTRAYSQPAWQELEVEAQHLRHECRRLQQRVDQLEEELRLQPPSRSRGEPADTLQSSAGRQPLQFWQQLSFDCALERSLSDDRTATGSHVGRYALNRHFLASWVSCCTAGSLHMVCHHCNFCRPFG